MTADRLDLDALAYDARQILGGHSARGMADAMDRIFQSVPALVALARTAEARKAEANQFGLLYEKVANALANAVAERDAAQAALARVTSVETEARLVKIISDAVNEQTDNRGRALEAADGVLVALREITSQGQEAGD